MIETRIDNSPSVSPVLTQQTVVPVALHVKVSKPKAIRRVLAFGFCLFSLFYLLDFVQVMYYYGTLYNTYDSFNLLLTSLKEKPVLALCPFIFLIFFFSHVFVGIKLIIEPRPNIQVGSIALLCSTLFLMILSIYIGVHTQSVSLIAIVSHL